ncbi:unnamed protein product [Calicophoron daubneyi]|uniref:EF-hand domain-containing protein n=1 Tax=Calicophoron daubneyi TaxID=300641 RepID=A0AAV2TI66_CALDB
MSEDKRAQTLLNIFKSLDADGNGTLSIDEIRTGLSSAGVSEKKIKKIIDKIDLNGDGEVTLGEYKVALGLTDEPLSQWKCLFESLDTDGSGEIDLSELRQLFVEARMPISEDALNDWIMAHDTDGNGRISYKEFLGFVAEQAEVEYN